MKISRHAGVVLRLGFAAILFLPVSLAHGGEQSDAPESYGGKAGAMLKPEEFVFSDRQQFAPTKKTLFVVGKDLKCHHAMFVRAENDDIKSLTVLDDGTEVMSKCIYQKVFSLEPSGFSIFVEGGGVCRPTYSSSIQDLEKHPTTALKITNKGVAITYCTKETVSYGEMLAKQLRGLATDPVKPAATPEVAPSPMMTEAPVQAAPPVPVATAAASASNSPMPGAAATPGSIPTVVAAPASPVSDDVPGIDFAPPKPIPFPVAELVQAPKAAHTPTAIVQPTSTPPPETSSLTVTLRPINKPVTPATKRGSEKYTVQILASTDEDEAKSHAHAAGVASKTPGFVIEAQVNGTTYFRVCVGQFETVHAAREFLAKNSEKFHNPEAFVQILPKK